MSIRRCDRVSDPQYKAGGKSVTHWLAYVPSIRVRMRHGFEIQTLIF